MLRNNPQALLDYVYTEVSPFRKLISRLCKVAATIHQQGFAEANAGNVSLRVSALLHPFLEQEGFEKTGSTRQWYLVSQSGSRFRDLAENPREALMLITDDAVPQYYPATAKPTSEWLCHRLLHEQYSGDDLTCLLHTHPTEVIALSDTALYDNQETLNSMLKSALPELEIFLPEGIATAPFAQAGSTDLAETSCIRIEDKRVLIWQKHGLIVQAENPDIALDLTEVVNKAAKLLLIKLSLSKA